MIIKYFTTAHYANSSRDHRFAYLIQVVGSNPSKADVKRRLGGLQPQVIAYKASEFRQFDEQGAPLYNPPGCFGIMQLEYATPRRGRKTSDVSTTLGLEGDVDTGLAGYNQACALVTERLVQIDRQYPHSEPLGEESMQLAAYRMYKTMVFCWDSDDTERRWKKTCDTLYAEDAMRIQSLVEHGTPPRVGIDVQSRRPPKHGVLQPIMPLDLPVKVRPWELTVYPRSHIRR